MGRGGGMGSYHLNEAKVVMKNCKNKDWQVYYFIIFLSIKAETNITLNPLCICLLQVKVTAALHAIDLHKIQCQRLSLTLYCTFSIYSFFSKTTQL